MAFERGGLGSLIQHMTFPAVHRIQHKEMGGWDNDVLTTKYQFVTAATCTVQNTDPEDMKLLEGGLANSQVYTLYCKSQLFEAINGTDLLSSSVYIPDAYFIRNDTAPPVPLGGWHTVVKNLSYNGGTLSHGRYLIVKDTTPNETEYPLYASEEINLLIPTRDDLFSSESWLSTWEAFNEE